MFRKLVIANRGEIAVRIIRTCRDLGVRTVALYADGDRDALHVRMADEAHHLAGSSVAETYLATDAVLGVAARAGADALHPGYGFLSENAVFAAAVEAAGLTFVGPPPSAIELMGDKITARRTAEAAGVAPVPGLTSGIAGAADVRAFGGQHGWPVAIKAAYGGGGRGLRVVDEADDVDAAVDAARREATASFGRPDLYVERYLSWPRHVEVQLLADSHGTIVSLGTRDCSVQRRHQKLVEESPAVGLDADLQHRMGEAAVAVGRACGYVNAGTVEFLVQDGEFWFLEMNTRLQVEHPVTELTTGLDLVEWQLRVAAGERLVLPARALAPTGHAIEVRINAEDPSEGRFLPSPGRLTAMRSPAGPGVRVDSGYEAGDEVSASFDNLVAKIVTFGADRDEARRRMLRALAELEVTGVKTTAAAHVAILSHPDFVEGRHSTRWLEERVDLGSLAVGPPGAAPAPPPVERPALGEPVELTAEIDGQLHTLKVWLPDRLLKLFAGRPAPSRPGGRAPLPRPAAPTRTAAAPVSRRAEPGRAQPAPVAGPGEVVAPMQGAIVRVLVAVGDAVAAGQHVCILEAMKMETPVVTSETGTVCAVLVDEGDLVDQGTVVARIETG